jgi:hypothetical protein
MGFVKAQTNTKPSARNRIEDQRCSRSCTALLRPAICERFEPTLARWPVVRQEKPHRQENFKFIKLCSILVRAPTLVEYVPSIHRQQQAPHTFLFFSILSTFTTYSQLFLHGTYRESTCWGKVKKIFRDLPLIPDCYREVKRKIFITTVLCCRL